MASRKAEDAHKVILDKILKDSGLECVRSAQESSETSSESEEIEIKEETDVIGEQQLEQFGEEDLETAAIEEPVEEEPAIFPTPSLRKVLPDYVRSIQQQNRIQVLPEEFTSQVDPNAIPKIESTPQQKCIDVLGEITGCVNYRKSLAEFWFLDTLANLLRRAQSDNMSRSARFIEEENYVPKPQEVNVQYKTKDSVLLSTSQTVSRSKHLVFKETAYECSMLDLTSIIHYIFDLFSTDYQYDLIRSIFTFPPDCTLIDAPYQIREPKRFLMPLKANSKKVKSPKKEKPVAKGKKKEPDNEDYLALLELRARDEKQHEEQEEKDREEWNLKSHILPLSLAADDAFFDMYWPPPPPPEPEPVVATPVKKGKGKK